MSLYERVLQELVIFEAEADLSINRQKFEQLRHNVMFILPFWNSRLGGYWEKARTTRKEHYEQLLETQPGYFQGWETFVDYWLQQVSCSMGLRFCEPRNRCLWHSAIDFYSCNHMEEEYNCILPSAMPQRLSCMEDEECDWVNFTEPLLENLVYVLRFVSLSDAVKRRIGVITEGLGVLRSFRKLMVKWKFEDMEEIKVELFDFYKSIQNLPRRAIHIFAQYVIFNRENMDHDGFSTLENMINSAILQAKLVYFHVLRALKLSNGKDYSLSCKTLLPLINDLQNILRTLFDDLSSSHKYVRFEDIVQELTFIRSIVDGVSEGSVESWIPYAIATHINVLAAQASDALSVSYSSERTLDLDAHYDNSGNAFYTEPKIKGIINDFKMSCRNCNMSSCYVGDLLSYLWLIGEEYDLRNPPIVYHISRLTLLYFFLKDTEHLCSLNPELQHMSLQIVQMFARAWWDLRSLCFKNLGCNKKDFPTLCLHFLKDLTTNMLQPDEMLLVIIQSLVKMPGAKYLLLDLRKSIVPTKQSKHFANLLYSQGSNLKKLMELDAISNFMKDVEVGGIKAAHIFILFFGDFNDDVSSIMVETVEGFEESVRQNYTEYMKMSNMELPESKIEFFDMMRTLDEFMESDAYFPVCFVKQIRLLHDNLVICSSFLRCNPIRYNVPEEVRSLRIRILKLGHQVNNILDIFDEFPDWFFKLRLYSVTEEVKLIKEKISKSDAFKTGSRRFNANDQTQAELYQATQQSSGDDPCPPDEDQIIGFDDEGDLMEQLTSGSKSLSKISIVGMPGLGKTTLAMNLYKGCAKSFYAHAWCYVGQQVQRKELLHVITTQISEKPSSKINAMKVEELAKELKQSLLKKKNYLIVLDDVWDIDAWNVIQHCFPPANGGSRILLTSRYKNVGEKVCGNKNVLELKPLSTYKSRQLLLSKVFGAKKCPQKLLYVAKTIAGKCEGLPLSIVLIAGVLKNKEKTVESWNQVEKSFNSYLADGMLNTFELSYRHLSDGMKHCLLYCTTFSKGKEIHRSKLVRQWLAERLVQDSEQKESLEGAAEKYLLELVDRNLLMVAKTGSDKRIKTCRIHDLLRDFCSRKANKEKFLITIDRWNDLASHQKHGRLLFCSTQDRFKDFKGNEGSTRQGIHSLICSTNSSSSISDVCNISFIFEHFRSLTLLNLENLQPNNKFSESVGGLKLLRYLAVRGCMESIPTSIGELLNLETLLVRGIRGEIDVPDTIFNLSKLRHLVVNKRARVRVQQSTRNSLSNLQIVSTPVLSRSTAGQIIESMPNVRKLRCILLEESFNLSSLDRLDHLYSLRAFYHGGRRFCGKLSFPSNLYKLTLYKFRLPWSDMEKIAALLPRLEILKLLFKAFEGRRWSTTATFQNLKYLRLEELDIQEWEASDDNFPALERLVFRRCKRLNKIPEKSLANIGSLMGIEAHWSDVSVVKSVLKIKKKQINGGNRKFETVVYPTVLDLDDDDDDDNDDDYGEPSD